MENSVNNEFELYEPMRVWLHTYLCDKYSGYDVITLDAHRERLDRVLRKYNILCDVAVGVEIQIDILGIVRKNKSVKLYFIEAINF